MIFMIVVYYYVWKSKLMITMPTVIQMVPRLAPTLNIHLLSPTLGPTPNLESIEMSTISFEIED